jgi:hypothetical protein
VHVHVIRPCVTNAFVLTDSNCAINLYSLFVSKVCSYLSNRLRNRPLTCVDGCEKVTAPPTHPCLHATHVLRSHLSNKTAKPTPTLVAAIMSDADSPIFSKRRERRPSRKIIPESPDSPLHARPRLAAPAMPGSPAAGPPILAVPAMAGSPAAGPQAANLLSPNHQNMASPELPAPANPPADVGARRGRTSRRQRKLNNPLFAHQAVEVDDADNSVNVSSDSEDDRYVPLHSIHHIMSIVM